MRCSASLIATLVVCASASPAWGQSADDTSADPALIDAPVAQSSIPTAPEGQVAESAAGQAGLRQTRDQIDGIDPLARINNRIQNRVQARVRNRIDRNYDPQANATSPFEIAGQATERATPRPR